jgi:RecA-family ATPase
MINPSINPKLVNIIRANEIEPKTIDWLWFPYIPYSKITLIQGDPGDGKSTFALTLSALLTRGHPLPFTDTTLDPINVIYQNTEDDTADTVIPRFIQAGGDLQRLCFINEIDKALTFADERIYKAIIQENARLLILDPLSSYIGNEVSLNQANNVRHAFNNLIRVAKDTGCAIVIVGHLNKMSGVKAIYRTLGSIDVIGAVRSALLIARTDSGNPNERIMVVQKSNLAPTGKAIIFSIDEKIEWVGQTDKTADEVLCNVNPENRADTKLQTAKTLITTLLSAGERSAQDVYDQLKAAGISQRTAENAKRELGIRVFRQSNAWYWSLT